MDGITALYASFLSLDFSKNDSRLTFFLTEGKRVFHESILSLVCSGNGFASGRLSYGQAPTYCPRPTLLFWYLCVRTYVRHYHRQIIHENNTRKLLSLSSYISLYMNLFDRCTYEWRYSRPLLYGNLPPPPPCV